jgi:hypothetical protein
MLPELAIGFPLESRFTPGLLEIVPEASRDNALAGADRAPRLNTTARSAWALSVDHA